MGVDIHAVAAWGIRITHGQIRRTHIKTRTWIGRPDGDRENEFDPKTGKPNYKVEEESPEELEKWELFNLGGYEASDSDECIITFASTSTPSHRMAIEAVKIPEKPVNDSDFQAFKTDMVKLDLWNESRYGLWLFIDAG